MDFSVPITIVIGVFAVLLGAYFQRRHWLNSNREAIKERETDAALQAINEFLRCIDRRIAHQRTMLNLIQAREIDPERKKDNQKSAEEWLSSINSLRANIKFYFGYANIIDTEEKVIATINDCGAVIVQLSRCDELSSEDIQMIDSTRKRLSRSSERAYNIAVKWLRLVAEERFGSMRKINDNRDIENQYFSTRHFIRELFNL